jgi:hypothetical protein
MTTLHTHFVILSGLSSRAERGISYSPQNFWKLGTRLAQFRAQKFPAEDCYN